MSGFLPLFFSFFQIGLMAFGGGLASMRLIEEQVVHLHRWLSLGEFADLVTIAEMTPGPIAINAATFVGMRIKGFPGALIATTGVLLPSIMIVALLAFLYARYKNLSIMDGILQGLRPAIVAMILSAGITILQLALFGDSGKIMLQNLDYVSLGCFLGGFILLRKFKISPTKVMIGAGILGAALHLWVV